MAIKRLKIEKVRKEEPKIILKKLIKILIDKGIITKKDLD